MRKASVICKIVMPMILILAVAVSIGWAAVKVGQKAPDFKLPSVSGKQVSLNDLRKDASKNGAPKVVLIDFWATWCGPCRNSIPHIQKLHEKYSKKGVSIVGISVDDKGAKVVKPFVEKNKLTYTILLDQKSEAADKYGVRAIPSIFIIDKKGVVRYIHEGFYPGLENKISKEIDGLLK